MKQTPVGTKNARSGLRPFPRQHIMKLRLGLILLLFAASAGILVWMYYAATRDPVAEGFAVGRNARRPGRLLPPQTRQIGAIRPFRRHRGRRKAPHGRTAVPGHGLLRAVAGEQLRDGDPPSRRSLHAPGEDHHFRRHDRRQPRTERRLRTTGPRRTFRSRHPPGRWSAATAMRRAY